MQRKALVTGASSGIGLAFAQALAREGYSVTAVARREDKLKELVATLSGSGHSYKQFDLSDTEQMSSLAAHISTTHYDLLINNAGAGVYDSFAKTPITDHERIMRLNSDAVMKLSHAFLQTVAAGDALVNVASILALAPYPGAGVYAATKAFVLSLSECLWYEQRERGVYVMALCPGVTESGFHEAAGGTPSDTPSRSLTQTADQVVMEALHALKKRKRPVVVSGWKNRLGLFLARFLTRRKLVTLMGSWD